ncbi:NAC domain-containing protein 53 [Oryza brachyantha]|uniref:NAC domain-containing protein n=1 Tax=Oryza brachyantha TaxID=4533 RepID=J3LII7_ORYBR|nr:NAC domain-containing protein 53 [Oryza brachyantha]
MTQSPPPDSAAAVPLAPGFRFHPTDEELVSYYLRRRIQGRRLRIDAIAEVDLYRLEPWDLPSLSRIRSRDAQWYFFARLDRKVTGAGAGGRGGPGNRTNRATPRGYWKTTGKDRDVHHRGKLVGMKKTLVFHSGRAPKGQRTNWVMHEYRLIDADGGVPQDLYVVCRIFQKTGSGPQNGAQYGAPYLEEDWEEEDDAIENAPASGTSTEIAAAADIADEESNEEDGNFSFKTNNEPLHTQECPPEIAPLKAQDSKETNGGGNSCDVFSLDEILQEPENVCKNEEQNAIDDNFTIAELGYPRQDDGYVGENGPVNWIGPSNGDTANWPLRAYSTQNHVNGTLSADGFFDTGNDTISYSGQQQICPSDNQNLYLQDDGLGTSHQVDDNMPFYDASSNHKWVDGKDDYVNLNDLLYPPVENQSLFDIGDDLMAYFDATEDDFKFDIMGTEGSSSQLPDMSNDFVQRDDNNNKFTLDGIPDTIYGASSSGSHGKYTDTAVPDMPMDDTVDKGFGKRLASMLGSIPAPPAMASELPPSTGKSVGPLSAVNPNSSIRVTAGIIQLGSLTFTGSTERLQKNGDFNLVLSFTVEGDVSTKSIDFEPDRQMSTTPMVFRSGMYLFFVSAMILMLSYKVGLCIYSR